MQIKRFQANDMAEALKMVKNEFGPEAVILSAREVKGSRSVFNPFQKKEVEITAAIDQTEITIKKPKSFDVKIPFVEKNIYKTNITQEPADFQPEKDFNNRLSSIRKSSPASKKKQTKSQHHPKKELMIIKHKLLSSGVEHRNAVELIDEVERLAGDKIITGKDSYKPYFLKVLSGKKLVAGSIKIDYGTQKIVALVGPAGVGKTTAIAKLAADLAIFHQKQVGLISFDNNCLGGSCQLEAYAQLSGIPLISTANSAEIKKAVKRFRAKDVILIDTPGFSSNNSQQMFELLQKIEIIMPDEIHLVLSASTKNRDLHNTFLNFKTVAVNRLLFTKIDESSDFGNLFNLLLSTKVPLSYISKGQKIPESLEQGTLAELLNLVFFQIFSDNYQSQKNSKVIDVFTEDYENENNAKEYYIANKNSDIFHKRNCKSVKRINWDNVIVFKNMEEALKQKFEPCRMCCEPKSKQQPYLNQYIKRQAKGY